MNSIVVLGANGQLGSALVQVAALTGRADRIRAIPGPSAGFDVLRDRLELPTGAVVINCIAHTRVDAAEADPDAARRLNVDAAAVVAWAAATAGAGLIHVSTDYAVGAGHRLGDGPIPEDAPPAPVGVYGSTKAAGELAVRAAHPGAIIARTAWLFTGPHAPRLTGYAGGDFVTTMLRIDAQRRAAHDDTPIAVVDDQFGSPSNAVDVAGALLALADRLASDRTDPAGSPGGAGGTTLHVVNGGAASWFELARAALAVDGRDPARIVRTTTAAYGAAAPRPACSVLGTAHLEALGLDPLPHWTVALTAAIAGSIR